MNMMMIGLTLPLGPRLGTIMISIFVLVLEGPTYCDSGRQCDDTTMKTSNALSVLLLGWRLASVWRQGCAFGSDDL